MALRLYFLNDLDLHFFVNDFYLFNKYCLMYSLLINAILDDLSSMS